MHGLHGLPQLCSFSGCVLKVFFEGFSGVFTFFPQVCLRRSLQPCRGGPHPLGSVHSVVVPNLKPSLQHITFAPVHFAQVPHVVKCAAPTRRHLKLYPGPGQGRPTSSSGHQLFRRRHSALHDLPHTRQPTEAVVILDRPSEVHSFSGQAVPRLFHPNGGFSIPNHADPMTQGIPGQLGIHRRNPIGAVRRGHCVG